MSKIKLNNSQGETPNIALDIETLSTQPTAAIISIAARTFSFHESPESQLCCDAVAEKFHCFVSASSCAMEGMHFDMQTVRFWQQQSEEAKAPFCQLTGQEIPIASALDLFTRFIDRVRETAPEQNIHLWCQGTDFDIPILKNAYHTVLGWPTPWQHRELRDSRTFIHTILGTLRPDIDDPYSLIPENPKWKPHDALSDVNQLIWNVTHVHRLLVSQHSPS